MGAATPESAMGLCIRPRFQQWLVPMTRRLGTRCGTLRLCGRVRYIQNQQD